MSSTPIGEHALLSDCHSSALVDTSGSVEWLTFPRFDSPAVMASSGMMMMTSVKRIRALSIQRP